MVIKDLDMTSVTKSKLSTYNGNKMFQLHEYKLVNYSDEFTILCNLSNWYN